MRPFAAAASLLVCANAGAQVPPEPDPPFDAELGQATRPHDPAELEKRLPFEEERLRLHLEHLGAQARSTRLAAGTTLTLFGAGLTASSGIAALRTGRLSFDDESRVLGVSGAVLLATGVLVLLVPDGEETMAREFSAAPSASLAERLARLEEFRARFRRSAEQTRSARILLGGVVIGAGALAVALGVVRHEPNWFAVTYGLALAAAGTYAIAWHEYPAERAWRFYEADVKIGDRLVFSYAPPIGLAARF